MIVDLKQGMDKLIESLKNKDAHDCRRGRTSPPPQVSAVLACRDHRLDRRSRKRQNERNPWGRGRIGVPAQELSN